ncbi:MAG TPA: YciI family protein [bacterium]
MKEYLYLYHNGATQLSPEQMQKNMQKWMTWMKELGEQGHLKDAGAPLDRTGRVVKGKPGALTDGPYAEVKDVIGGFTLVKANDLAQAAQLSKGCPIFETGGSVEVRPVLGM